MNTGSFFVVAFVAWILVSMIVHIWTCVTAKALEDAQDEIKKLREELVTLKSQLEERGEGN
jgi:hypothetical protein